MENKQQEAPLINEDVKQKHTRQKWLQIYLPLIAGIVILGIFVLILVLQQVSDASTWADISLIFLILPTMLAAILMIVVCGGLIFGLIKLFEVIPPGMFKVQQFFSTVRDYTVEYSQKITTPVIDLKANAARAEKLFAYFKKN